MALLPEGLRDTLPPHAAADAHVLRAMIDTLAINGYDRVATPLVEFDDALDAALEGSTPHERFRFMDSTSQRLLAVRDDITGQIARLATTRLAHWPRPLRLSYAGPVLRVRGTQLRAERQFLQVGAEYIGAHDSHAIAEVILVAVAAVRATGMDTVAVDLVLPDFIKTLAHDLPPLTARALIDACDAKDAGALRELDIPSYFTDLIHACGPAADVSKRLFALFPNNPHITTLNDVIARLAQADIHPSLDPCEQRGFEFQTKIGFSLFSPHITGELGRGGCYTIHRSTGPVEEAVGFSLYGDGLRTETAPMPTRLMAEHNTPRSALERFQHQGYVTVLARPQPNLDQQARQHRCAFVLEQGQLRAVKG